MIAVLINTICCLVGSAAGLCFRRILPEKFYASVMSAIGLCTILIGIQGAIKTENVLVVIISMVVGVAVGTALDLDGKINALASWTETRFQKNDNDSSGKFAQGLVTAFLLWCVGAMTIVGSLEAGFGIYDKLYAKSLLDLISSTMLASSLGVGVIFASLPLFLFQGGLVLLSGLLQPLLSDAMVTEITAVGSLTIFALGLNLIGVTKFKVANYLPAIVAAPFFCALIGWIGEISGRF